MLYSEYEGIRRNFESVYKNIHCQLTHDNTFVIQECNKLINRLNDPISFQYESERESFEMGGYREKNEMVSRLEKLRDIASKNRDSQRREIDPDVYLPEVDSTPIAFNSDSNKIDGLDDTLQGIDTTIKNVERESVEIDDSLSTIDSLGVDLFNNNNNNSIEIYTKTELNERTYLPLRYNESFNVFFGVNGYKNCNMDKNQLEYFNESCDTLATVEYNGHDGSVDVCDTLFNILESAKNNSNTVEAVSVVSDVKANIISSLKYLCSIDDSYNEYSKFYMDFASMCDDLISKIKSSEESSDDNDLFNILSNEGVLLPIVKVVGSKDLRAFIGPSKSVLVSDSVDVIDCTVFNINASLAKISKVNGMYETFDYIHVKIDDACSGTLDESHISKLNKLIHSIDESYSIVAQYSGDIETYKYVYDYYIDYINGIITGIVNSKRDEEITSALNNIGSVKEDKVVVPNNTDFSLSGVTDFSKSWYDDTEDMDFFLRYFTFEDNRMLGPNGIYYTLVSDLLVEEEHFDDLNIIAPGTYSKGTTIAPDGTMLKYTHGEMCILTQREWISELGCGDIDNSESNKKSKLYNGIIRTQDVCMRYGTWKDCFPLNGGKEEFSKVPLIARCFFREDESNKRPVFFNGFEPRLDDSDRGLQDTSYFLKPTRELGDSYRFLYANRIILNGKGSAVKEQDEAIEKEKKKESMRQITNDKLNTLTKGKVQSVDGVIDLTGSVLKGLGSMSGKAGNTISKFFKHSKK